MERLHVEGLKVVSFGCLDVCACVSVVVVVVVVKRVLLLTQCEESS